MTTFYTREQILAIDPLAHFGPSIPPQYYSDEGGSGYSPASYKIGDWIDVTTGMQIVNTDPNATALYKTYVGPTLYIRAESHDTDFDFGNVILAAGSAAVGYVSGGFGFSELVGSFTTAPAVPATELVPADFSVPIEHPEIAITPDSPAYLPEPPKLEPWPDSPLRLPSLPALPPGALSVGASMLRALTGDAPRPASPLLPSRNPLTGELAPGTESDKTMLYLGLGLLVLLAIK